MKKATATTSGERRWGAPPAGHLRASILNMQLILRTSPDTRAVPTRITCAIRSPTCHDHRSCRAGRMGEEQLQTATLPHHPWVNYSFILSGDVSRSTFCRFWPVPYGRAISCAGVYSSRCVRIPEADEGRTMNNPPHTNRSIRSALPVDIERSR